MKGFVRWALLAAVLWGAWAYGWPLVTDKLDEMAGRQRTKGVTEGAICVRFLERALHEYESVARKYEAGDDTAKLARALAKPLESLDTARTECGCNSSACRRSKSARTSIEVEIKRLKAAAADGNPYDPKRGVSNINTLLDEIRDLALEENPL